MHCRWRSSHSVLACRVNLLQCFTQSRAYASSPSRINNSAFVGMHAATSLLIDKASKPPTKWTRTKDLRSEQKRLTDTIKTLERKPMPTLEKTTFDAGGGLFMEEEEHEGDSYEPGTFVELRRNTISSLGVVLGETYDSRRWQVVSLVSSGEVWTSLRDDIMFAVPGLTTPDLATRCSIWDLAKTPTELSARVEVLRRLHQIERAMEDAQNALTRASANVYATVKHPDPDEWSSTTVSEVARILSPKNNLVTIFATHKYLMDNPEMFVADASYRVSQSFSVVPQSHIDASNVITAWSRQQNSPLDSFAAKARPVMALNRKLQTETSSEVPTVRPAKHKWDDNDKLIIQFLQRSLRPARSNQNDPYALGQGAILKRIDRNRLVDDAEVHKVLVDLGVFAPWQDLLVFRRDLNLDLKDPKTSPLVKETNELVRRSLASKPPAAGPFGPEDFYPSDPLESVRHDFGQLPVYIVDDAHAKELDDGISIEEIPSEPEHFWVHVHIADPASTIPPTHILAQRAQKITTSVYFLHRAWPLFPKSLMFSEAGGMSLQSNRKRARVLTFSAKIDPQGELVDYKVRAGIIRNMCQFSYDALNLTLDGRLTHRWYPFGNAPPLPEPASVTEAQRKDMTNFVKVQKRLLARNHRMGVFTHTSPEFEIINWKTPEGIETPTLAPSEFRGFPSFGLHVHNVFEYDAGARSIVAETAKLACRVASLWCRDHDVPALRRTSAAIQTASETDLQKILDMRTENNYVDFVDILNLVTVIPSGGYSLEPLAHSFMGIKDGEGYVRVTSPLRRYSDYMVHCQIHRALRGEKPVWSGDELMAFIARYKVEERLRRRVEGGHRRFWGLVALKRWMENPDLSVPDPLKDLEAVVMKVPRFNTTSRQFFAEVILPKLGMNGFMSGFPGKGEGFEMGHRSRVAIDRILLGVKPHLELTMKN